MWKMFCNDIFDWMRWNLLASFEMPQSEIQFNLRIGRQARNVSLCPWLVKTVCWGFKNVFSFFLFFQGKDNVVSPH